jgi:hypothetical protein
VGLVQGGTQALSRSLFANLIPTDRSGEIFGLWSVFDKFAIKVINPVGERFDPHRHQAISQVESDQEANTVVTVLQKGYLLHDRVLRPALVTVAKARDAKSGASDAEPS